MRCGYSDPSGGLSNRWLMRCTLGFGRAAEILLFGGLVRAADALTPRRQPKFNGR